MTETVKKRTLYRAAAVAMLLILPLAVYPSLLALAALGSLPALILPSWAWCDPPTLRPTS